MCPGIFVQGPENFLRAQGLSFRCAVEPAQAAVIDSTTRVEINHDIFYCSSAAAARRFRAAPLRFVHALSDPISHQRFRLTATTPHLRWRGRAYYFATTATRRTFVAHPDSFAVRRGERMH